MLCWQKYEPAKRRNRHRKTIPHCLSIWIRWRTGVHIGASDNEKQDATEWHSRHDKNDLQYAADVCRLHTKTTISPGTWESNADETLPDLTHCHTALNLQSPREMSNAPKSNLCSLPIAVTNREGIDAAHAAPPHTTDAIEQVHPRFCPLKHPKSPKYKKKTIHIRVRRHELRWCKPQNNHTGQYLKRRQLCRSSLQVCHRNFCCQK